MTRTPSLACAAGTVLTVLLLGACASAPMGGTDVRLDDIVRIPLARPEIVLNSAREARGAMALAPLTAAEPERIRREEALRRELGVDHAPDGSWDGCFKHGWGAGC